MTTVCRWMLCLIVVVLSVAGLQTRDSSANEAAGGATPVSETLVGTTTPVIAQPTIDVTPPAEVTDAPTISAGDTGDSEDGGSSAQEPPEIAPATSVPDDPDRAGEGEVTTAAVDYELVFPVINSGACSGAQLSLRDVVVGNQIRFGQFSGFTSGDEPIVWSITISDAEGNSSTVSTPEWPVGSGQGIELFTTVTTTDALNWEIARTVTATARGSISGQESTEVFSGACAIAPLVAPVAFITCPVNQGPYGTGDSFRFRVTVDNTIPRSNVSLSDLFLTASLGTFAPSPPDFVALNELLQFELIHTLTEEELGKDLVVTLSWGGSLGPPSGSAAAGLVSPSSISFGPSEFTCFPEAEGPATSTPTSTPTATSSPTPTATASATATEDSEPSPTATDQPSATVEPDGSPTSVPSPGAEPTREPTGQPTLESSHTATPESGISTLPDTGAGGERNGSSFRAEPLLVLVAVLVTAGILLPMRRRMNR